MQETSGKTKLKQGMTEEDKEYCADCFLLRLSSARCAEEI